MSRYACLFQPAHEKIAHTVIDNALARDTALFQTVERRGVILVADDEFFGIVRTIDTFSLSFVQKFFLFHVPLLPRSSSAVLFKIIFGVMFRYRQRILPGEASITEYPCEVVRQSMGGRYGKVSQ